MRKAKPKKRYVLPDPKYKDTLVTRFVNNLMLEGKKNVAYSIFYKAVDQVQEKSGENGIEVWKKALNNVMPVVEVKSRRVGGATFQVPVEIRPERKINLSIKWLIDYSRARGEKTMMDKLAAEIIAASKGEARRLVQSGGIKRNDEAVNDPGYASTEADLTGEGYIKLSAGKKRHALVRVK